MSEPIDPVGDELLADVVASPEDDSCRLIYSDYLEDTNQEPALREFIRLQIALTKNSGAHEQYITYANRRNRMHSAWPDSRRCAEILHDAWSGYLRRVGLPGVYGAHVCNNWQFRRGFLESVRVRSAFWHKFSPCLMRAHPITHVRFTDLNQRMWNVESATVSAFTPGPLYGYENSELPDYLWNRLLGHLTHNPGWRHRPDRRLYLSEAEATGALSRAALAWASDPQTWEKHHIDVADRLFRTAPDPGRRAYLGPYLEGLT